MPLHKEELKKDTELDDPAAKATVATDILEESRGNKPPEKPGSPPGKETPINALIKSVPKESKKSNAPTEKIEPPNPLVKSIESQAAKKDVKLPDSVMKKTDIVTATVKMDDSLSKIKVEKPSEKITKKEDIKPDLKTRKGRRATRQAQKKNVIALADTTASKTATLKPIKATADSLKKQALADTAKSKLLKLKQDSLIRARDTTKTRIVLAYHKAKIFKSDLQAKADSMFFTYKDSTVRCYVNPIIWAQGSQLTADTVFIQLKNKKLDNMLLQHKAFIVNTEADSTKIFNQIKGKVITGYFRDSKLDRMFVDGNAESIYYIKEDTAYTGMNHMISSRIKILFNKNQLKDIISIRKPDGEYFPIDEIPKDKDILEGFIWKPKERPSSKQEVIKSSVIKVKPAEKKKLPAIKKPVKDVIKTGSKSELKAKPESSVKTEVKVDAKPEVKNELETKPDKTKTEIKTDPKAAPKAK